VLSKPRQVLPGEVDHEIDLGQLHQVPTPIWDVATLSSCYEILDRYVRPARGDAIPDAVFCDLPRWVFLEFAVGFGGVLLQGANDPDRAELRASRLSLSIVGWNRLCHFAFSNSIEAIFDAILDGPLLDRLDCPLRSSTRQPGRRFYYGLDYRALAEGPWKSGTVYLYDARAFPSDFATEPFLSEVPIRPMAKVRVNPLDWPLLDKVDGVDVVAQTMRHWETYRGFPWRGDETIHPHLQKRPLVAQMCAAIEDRLDRPIGLKELGSRVGLSPPATLRLFRAFAGVSPHTYGMARRIERAKAHLRDDGTIGRVALETGFSDQAHFTRQFRQAVGLTPGEYLRAQDSSRRAI